VSILKIILFHNFHPCWQTYDAVILTFIVSNVISNNAFFFLFKKL